MTELNQSQDNPISYWLFLIPLFTLSFLVFSEHLIVVPLSAEISVNTGLPAVRSGLLVSVYPLAAAFSAFVSAPFSDRLGRKRMLMILGCGFCFSTFGFATSNDIPTLMTFRVLSGVFAGPIPANVLAFAGDSFQGKERAKIITTIMLTFSVASILAVPFGAWLAELSTWRVPFYFISGCIVFCLFLVSRIRSISTGAEKGKILAQYREFTGLLLVKKVRKVIILQVFMIIGLFGIVPNVSVWLSSNYGYNATQIGFCYMAGGIGGIIGNTLSGYFLNKGYKEQLISIGSILMSAFLFLTAFDTLPSFFIPFFFTGLMFSGSFRMPALQIIITELIPIHMRGRLMSLTMITANITMGLGGICSIPFLKMENGRLLGMATISLLGSFSLLVVPFLVLALKKELAKADAVY